MKKIKFLLVAGLGLFLFSSAFAQDEVYVDFVEGEWDKVVKKAKKQDKFIMVDAYTDWCYWCKVMDKETFTDPDVVAYLDENFVSTKINCEKGIGADFAMKFRVAGYPSLLFFNSEGQLVGRDVGYESDNSAFIETLKSMKAITDKQPYAFDSKNWYPGFPDFYKKSFKKDDMERVAINPEEAIAFLETQEDLFGEVAFSVMTRTQLNEKYNNFFMENYGRYKKMYGPDEANRIVQNAVGSQARQAIENQDFESLQAAFDMLDALENPDLKERYVFAYTGQFYQKGGDWNSYADLYQKKYDESDVKDITGTMNSASWTMYLECDDEELLKKAAEWMKNVTEVDPQYAYLDTYMALLYKLGDTKNALIAGEKALKAAEANGEDAQETKDIMMKLKHTMKSKEGK